MYGYDYGLLLHQCRIYHLAMHVRIEEEKMSTPLVVTREQPWWQNVGHGHRMMSSYPPDGHTLEELLPTVPY